MKMKKKKKKRLWWWRRRRRRKICEWSEIKVAALYIDVEKEREKIRDFFFVSAQRSSNCWTILNRPRAFFLFSSLRQPLTRQKGKYPFYFLGLERLSIKCPRSSTGLFSFVNVLNENDVMFSYLFCIVTFFDSYLCYIHVKSRKKISKRFTMSSHSIDILLSYLSRQDCSFVLRKQSKSFELQFQWISFSSDDSVE